MSEKHGGSLFRLSESASVDTLVSGHTRAAAVLTFKGLLPAVVGAFAAGSLALAAVQVYSVAGYLSGPGHMSGWTAWPIAMVIQVAVLAGESVLLMNAVLRRRRLMLGGLMAMALGYGAEIALHAVNHDPNSRAGLMSMAALILAAVLCGGGWMLVAAVVHRGKELADQAADERRAAQQYELARKQGEIRSAQLREDAERLSAKHHQRQVELTRALAQAEIDDLRRELAEWQRGAGDLKGIVEEWKAKHARELAKMEEDFGARADQAERQHRAHIDSLTSVQRDQVARLEAEIDELREQQQEAARAAGGRPPKHSDYELRQAAVDVLRHMEPPRSKPQFRAAMRAKGKGATNERLDMIFDELTIDGMIFEPTS